MANREIFCFEYEGRKVHKDPQKLYRAFFKALGKDNSDLNLLIERIKGDNEELSERSMEILLAAIQTAYGVKELDDDGHGMTEKQMVELHNSYFAYLDEKKTEDENSPTCSPPSDQASLPSTNVSEAAPSIGEIGSACGSTAAV